MVGFIFSAFIGIEVGVDFEDFFHLSNSKSVNVWMYGCSLLVTSTSLIDLALAVLLL